MYVTKTIASLTTYSKKPVDYNGTLFFEIDIMKNSVKLDFNTKLLVVSFVLIYCNMWSWAESAVSLAEKKCYFGFDMAKNVNIKLSGNEFLMMSISKIIVPL